MIAIIAILCIVIGWLSLAVGWQRIMLREARESERLLTDKLIKERMERRGGPILRVVEGGRK